MAWMAVSEFSSYLEMFKRRYRIPLLGPPNCGQFIFSILLGSQHERLGEQ